jgi:YbbR domain-containing protein
MVFDRLMANWLLKLLALGLAFAIWVAVTGESRVFHDVDVPLEIGLRDDCVLSGKSPTTISVRLRGAESTVRRLTSPVRLSAFVDLRGAAPGQRKILVDAGAIQGFPPDIEVVMVTPDRLDLKIERRMRKSVPVVPSVVGRPASGYTVYGTEAVPDVVEVEGPESDMASLRHLRTDPIHVDGKVRGFTTVVGAVPDGASVRVVDPKPVEVRVLLDVTPAKREFDDITVLFTGQRYYSAAVPSRVQVVVSGPPGLVTRIRRDQVRAIVDVTGLSPGTSHTLPVRTQIVDVPSADAARLSVRAPNHGQVSVRISDRRLPG